MVNGVGLWEDDLRDGDEGIPVLEELLNDTGQGVRGMEGGIVEEYNRSRLNFGKYTFSNFGRLKLFPI